MLSTDIKTYNIILKGIKSIKVVLDGIIDEFRDAVDDLESNPTPAPENVQEATALCETIMNHVLASKHLDEAYTALAFYRALLKASADEEDEEYDPDDEDEESFDEDEDEDAPFDNDESEEDISDSGIIYLHDFKKK